MFSSDRHTPASREHVISTMQIAKSRHQLRADLSKRPCDQNSQIIAPSLMVRDACESTHQLTADDMLSTRAIANFAWKTMKILLQIIGIVILLLLATLATLKLKHQNDDGPSVLFPGGKLYRARSIRARNRTGPSRTMSSRSNSKPVILSVRDGYS